MTKEFQSIMKTKLLIIVITLLLFQSCSIEKLYQSRQSRSSFEFEQVDFDDIVKLYMGKNIPDDGTIEGIYSVSSLIVKKGKNFFSSTEKEKVMNRRENYSKVAIFKDREKSDRDFFEVTINKSRQVSYSIRGEFSKASEGNILIYKHFETRSKVLTYTFTYDRGKDILEGIRTENNGSSTITYTLTYIKLYPKGSEIVSN